MCLLYTDAVMSEDTTNKITIQQRITQKCNQIMEPVEAWLDRIITMPDRFNPETFKVLDHFKKEQVKGAHARKIIELYEPFYKEYKDVLHLRKQNIKFKEISDDEDNDSEDRQLLESYEDYTDEVLQKGIKAYDNIFEACEYMHKVAMANRKAPKRKPKDPAKVVAKLKFAQKCDEFNLISIDPKEIIGANELFVYNIKTRKIGNYIASVIDPRGLGREGTGLNVKGSTIRGFKEEESVQKTLRKPKEMIKQFANVGPVKIKSLFNEIKTMDLKLNGRINEHTILLRVIR